MTTAKEHADRALREARREAVAHAMSYGNEFLRMRCAPDLLRDRLFPNFKEITESMGAYAAVRRALQMPLPGSSGCPQPDPWFSPTSFGDPSYRLVAVGDGSAPRTAALFAYRTRWTCHSVDPQLRDESRWSCIERLSLHRHRVESFKLPACPLAVVVCVHSHARLPEVVAACAAAKKILLISIPCCVPQELPRGKPDDDYADPRIASEKNRVLVWWLSPNGSASEIGWEFGR